MTWGLILGLALAPTEGVETAPTEGVETPPAEAAETPTVVLRAPQFLEPRRPPGRNRSPRGRMISRFTDRPPLVRTALRVAPGFSARLNDRPYAAFGFDVLASVMLGLHGGYRQWGLAPEVGYSLRTPGLEHRVLGGVGLIYGINADSWSVGWLPRVVLQPDSGAMGLGVRNGLWFDFAENGFSVELSHQWLQPGMQPGMQSGGAAQHELQVTLGLDLAMLALVLGKVRLAWI